uniref:ORF92 n=1 Tax=Cydia pomonella granulosis virus TaxID=28289 RepID=A0A097P0S8_GVCP|nr:ORF92 [Cydia pomonella granulovirus]AIU37299.1 ORF92 [Cydia pomonella granulovirus]QDW81152.1 ORF92 [Cydia pomonella granulovirus]QGY99487.1 ORF92 [Cydia pomonella granulovirus]QGY99912.1 ORF92 [Cydia pomonella granulovirus]
MATTINLFTYKPPPNTVCDDDIDKQNFFIQGVLEALNDNSKSKQACFLELKREQCLLLRKIKHDLLYSCEGNYCQNHVLLDALHLYKLYKEEFDDTQSAFDIDLMQTCREMVYLTFELFSCAANIVVFVHASANYKDNVLAQLLVELQSKNFITLMKTVSL